MKYYIVWFKTGEYDSIVAIDSFDEEESREACITEMEKRYKLPYEAYYFTRHEEIR